MAGSSQLDFEQEEPPATEEQLLGEELSREPAEEKWPRGGTILFTFSASLALWGIILLVISRIF